MNPSLVIQSVVVQFDFNAHHSWAKCPLCGLFGPKKEDVVVHLNSYHSIPGEDWTLVETRRAPPYGLDVFWLAVKQFHPGQVKQSTPQQDRKALESMKKAKVLPQEILQRIEGGIKKAEQIKPNQQVKVTKPRKSMMPGKNKSKMSKKKGGKK